MTFDEADISGSVCSSIGLTEPPAAVARKLIDPASAMDTIHWGRNYLYSARLETSTGVIEVVVKQLRNQGIKARIRRYLRGSRALQSWRMAQVLIAAGIRTPAPVMLVESKATEGPSYFITRRLHGASEVRHFFRRLDADTGGQAGGGSTDQEVGEFPAVEPERMLEALGRLARRLHDAGIWYRDLSIGNVLVHLDEEKHLRLDVVDYNRARSGQRLGVLRRCRDICRFPVLLPEHRRAFLQGYWGKAPAASSIRSWLWIISVRGYLLKHALKKRMKSLLSKRQPSTGGRHHAHLPDAAADASARDRVVWDRLSDQPHQHAGAAHKAAIRASDSRAHLRDLAVVAASLPRVWRRYLRLRSEQYQHEARFHGAGIALRPFEQSLEQQIDAVSDLGVSSVLIRLHPWEESHDLEESLARAMHESGREVSFALPQNRDLVRDPERWTAAIEELAERFTPYGRHFQVGQAVNRSKWGVWTRDEYLDLYLRASEILRRYDDVVVMGPAVIDFEHHMTMALVNRKLPGLGFDAVSSLLYVDRRGAPENRQLGFDTTGKVLLLRAIAETGCSSGDACWLTEVNWPLWEGPHSPAGRKVSVDETRQADYLVRYFLLTLCTGLVERVFWWRLIARGYGLIGVSGTGELRRRPAYLAMQTMIRQLEGSIFTGPTPAADGCFLWRFDRGLSTTLVGWATVPHASVELPDRPARVISRDGEDLPLPDGTTLELGESPVYVHL